MLFTFKNSTYCTQRFKVPKHSRLKRKKEQEKKSSFFLCSYFVGLVSSIDPKEKVIAKLADFGTAVELTNHFVSGAVAANPLWVAPGKKEKEENK